MKYLKVWESANKNLQLIYNGETAILQRAERDERLEKGYYFKDVAKMEINEIVDNNHCFDIAHALITMEGVQ